MKAFINFIEIISRKSLNEIIDECLDLTLERYNCIRKIKYKKRKRKGRK